MQIEKIITPKTTGYASVAALGFTVLSGVSKNKCLKKAHKSAACVTAGITLLHVGLVEYYHYKYKPGKKIVK